MPKVSLRPSWSISNESGKDLGPEIFTLLDAIRNRGRLTAAAKDLGVSYRHAWNMVQHWRQFFGTELISFTQGKGAALTDVGEKLLWAEQRASARIGLQLDSLTSELNLELNRTLTSSKTALTIYASYGFAVAYLPELLKSKPDIQVDLRYLGAVESLSALSRGDCDLAGFHLPQGGYGKKAVELFSPLLDSNEHKLVHLVTRTQGLFVAPGNPNNIRTLSDLKDKKIRFINRQKGSGTRILFDELLKKNSLASEDVSGYQSEEYTHAAVAAYVASGMADAGFGVQPAADQFNLEFIPLAKEKYLFAVAKRSTQKREIIDLLNLLKGTEFQNYVGSLAGYSAPDAGEIVSIKEGLIA
jgi:putative molybdopterin biosynthesis protein